MAFIFQMCFPYTTNFYMVVYFFTWWYRHWSLTYTLVLPLPYLSNQKKYGFSYCTCFYSLCFILYYDFWSCFLFLTLLLFCSVLLQIRLARLISGVCLCDRVCLLLMSVCCICTINFFFARSTWIASYFVQTFFVVVKLNKRLRKIVTTCVCSFILNIAKTSFIVTITTRFEHVFS